MRMGASSPRPLLHKFVEERVTHVEAMGCELVMCADWRWLKLPALRDAAREGE